MLSVIYLIFLLRPHAHRSRQLNACTEKRGVLMLNFIVRPLPSVQAILLVPLTTLQTLACRPSAHSPPVLLNIASQIPSSSLLMVPASPPQPTSPNQPLILFMLTINSHSHHLWQHRRLHTIALTNTPLVIALKRNFFLAPALFLMTVSLHFQLYTRIRSPHPIRAPHGMLNRTMSVVIL